MYAVFLAVAALTIHPPPPVQTQLISEPLVLFVVSTSGNGDFPTSSLSFWKFLLRSTLPTDILSDLAFMTFGLGDSSYARYCWPSRKLNKRLKGLGAQELIDAGEADDQHYLGIEGTLRPWMDKLWDTLDEFLPPLEAGTCIMGDNEQLPPMIRVQVWGQSERGRVARKSNGTGSSSSLLLAPGWKRARVAKMERMTSEDHWQDVRLIELEDCDGSALG